jgi:ABC-type transporter Mla subunit MlaD
MRRLAAISALVAAIVAGVIATGSSRGAGGPYQVTAIFDNAAFAVPGEDVRIAGANVGSIKSLDVCTTARSCSASFPPNKAAVTIEIDDARFTPFYANATCAIRPQSLIGERYVDCEPGSSSAPQLPRIASGPGAGTYLLPLTQTSSPIDSDIVQDIYQEPIRERFALILDELGTGLAARGSDLNAVIHRANPALGYTDQVIKILAQQNRQLAQLATDSDTVLAPLARAKQELSGFVVNANTTSVASAARANDIARSFQLFPEFLRQLRPLMVDLGQLADQGTPLLRELGQSASAVAQEFENLTPFANVARPALIALGNSSQQSQPALVASEPLARKLESLGQQALPSATLLDRLTASLENTGAIEQLMSLLFNGANAGNGFDSFGHYVRTESLVLGDCVPYSTIPQPGCSAKFTHGAGSAAAAAASDGGKPSQADRVAVEATKRSAAKQQRTATALSGLMRYLTGNAQ